MGRGGASAAAVAAVVAMAMVQVEMNDVRGGEEGGRSEMSGSD